MKIALLGLTITLIFITINLGFTEIYQRVLEDGAIEYYNKQPMPKKINFPQTYDHLIQKYCKINGINPYLIKCLIKVESDYNPNAVSITGAMGLMQLMQDTAEFYTSENPMKPEVNLQIGIKHFAFLMRYFKNEVPLALAAYHAGIGTVKKNMKIPPIKATIEYVNRVMLYYTGNNNYTKEVKKLYQYIDKEGNIFIYSK